MKRLLLLIISSYILLNNLLAQQNNFKAYNYAMSAKNYSDAVKIMTDTLKKMSNRTSDNFYRRASAYAMLGEYEYAIADCTFALIADPRNQDAFYLRGKCKFEYGDPTYVSDFNRAGKSGLDFLASQNIKIEQVESNNQHKQVIADVDLGIPMASSGTNKKTFVLIITIEQYMENNISDVRFAKNDGEVFKTYCTNTLGIPNENIHIKNNATKNQIRSELRWLKSIAEAFKQDINIIFYYSGHGMPDEVSRKSYLLPSDGIANDPESAYQLSYLYSQLGETNANSVIVFLDACFSGGQKGGLLLTSKGVAIKPRNEEIDGRIVVFSASQGDETAYQYEEKGHGLFTYFLLKKLKESKGNITLYDLGEYITEKVRQTSVVMHNKPQTPQVCTSFSFDDWKNLKLK